MINLSTTFSKIHYEIYGRRWIESVIRYWPEDTNVTLYVDFELNNLPKNFTILNFDKEFPTHKNFVEKIKTFYNKSQNPKAFVVANKTIKFSYKSFVIANELTKGPYTIWLDADTETTDKINFNTLLSLLENKFLACQIELPKHRHSHVESGFLLFNSEHHHSILFQKEFYNFYNSKKIFSLKKPYDGYVIAKIIKDLGLDYIDLNKGFNVDKKRSDPGETFLHPYLNTHFIHKIGNNKL